jgi:hypothetical protein
MLLLKWLDDPREEDSNGVQLFWILRFSGYEGSFADAKAPYDSPSLVTIFSMRRRLGRDEEAADGAVSGTR